jgi:hypothetical protein
VEWLKVSSDPSTAKKERERERERERNKQTKRNCVCVELLAEGLDGLCQLGLLKRPGDATLGQRQVFITFRV